MPFVKRQEISYKRITVFKYINSIFAHHIKHKASMITKIITLKSILLASVATVFFNYSNAQSNNICGSDQVIEQWRRDNPTTFNDAETAGAVSHTRRTKITIPVVFHVLHSNGPENIPDARFFDQIKILNEDYSATNPDVGNVRNSLHAPFAALVADFEIEFVLAKRDPNGKCTNGINRIYTNIHSNARDNVKEIVLWDPSHYLNIWVVSSINSSGAKGTVLGFANFPWMSPKKDGIVVIASEIGYSGNDKGRTLTHEIGHWLGLLHTFQGGCTYPNDRVEDTPLVKEEFTNTSCPPTGNSCAVDAKNNPLDTLYDQWENYMDYSHGCQVMFTIGQKERVEFYLTSKEYNRYKLYTEENLAFTGITGASTKPIATFNADKRVICAGSQVKFTQVTCAGINTTSRTWTFEGADNTTSSDLSPTVTYSKPGKYAVKLKVTNSSGEDEYEIKEYIQVNPLQTDQNGFFEGFEEPKQNSFASSGLYQVTGPGFYPFNVLKDVGYAGKYCIMAPINTFNFAYRFGVETPGLDMTKIQGDPIISFMVSYARRNDTIQDVIKIFVSQDCGGTWQQVSQKNSAIIKTFNGFGTGYVPQTPEDWKRVDYTLTAYKNAPNLKIRIVVESGGGNPIYIDNINLSQYYTSIPTIDQPLDAVIYPNPSNGNFTIQMASLQTNNHTKIAIVDINGKEVALLQNNIIQGQNLSLDVNPKDYNMTQGIYFIKIETNDGVVTKKFILTD